jgi:hypothetical protein
VRPSSAAGQLSAACWHSARARRSLDFHEAFETTIDHPLAIA